YDQGLDFILSFYACLHGGFIAVPVGTPTKRERLKRTQSIFENALPSLVLCTPKFLKNKKFASFRSTYKDCKWTTIEDLVIESEPSPVQLEITAETVAYLQYTSGSTGNPKGNIIDHENIVNNLANLQSYLQHDGQSICVSWLPFFHDMGLVYGLLQPIYNGYHCVLMSPLSFTQNPLRWLKAISNYRATHSAAPSFAYELCLDIPEKQREGLDLSSWEATINGAEVIRASVIEKFNEAYQPYGWRTTSWNPGYGLAEITLAATTTPKGTGVTVIDMKVEDQFGKIHNSNETTKRLVACGTINSHTDIRIVNPSSFEPVANGKIGEIWLAGKSVAKGYWNNPVATVQTFQATIKNESQHFLRTGDLGFIQNNQLFFVSRIKELIILNGQNHYPTDLEQVVESCDPAIRKTGVCAFSLNTDQQEKVVLICEINRTAIKGLDTVKLVKKIRASLIDTLGVRVSTIYFIRPMALPRTTSGKIKRVECRKKIANDELSYIHLWQEQKNDEKARSKSSLNKLIHELCRQVAKVCKIAVAEIDIHEPLSYCGLDSILATTLAQQLSTQYNKDISPTLFYDYPSIQLIAEYLSDLASTESSGVSRQEKSTAEGHIAIVGMGCRFPGASDLDEFWTLLQEGRCAIQKYPKWRWNHNTTVSGQELPAIEYGGLIEDIDLFDPGFFGISPREAVMMDPQQRLLLEVTWEALQDAGIKPSSLQNSNTGVYIGISTNDYAELAINETAPVHAVTGTSLSIAASRISYLLNLKGPSVAIDTACSSSLVAVDRAVKDLQAGIVDMAIVGGVNLLLNPDISVVFARNGMTSPDGKCKVFDQRASGYVRSEGCGLIVLKRGQDIQTPQDNVWALIRGSAINQDGKSNGITAPNGGAQKMVLEQALKSAAIDPQELDLIEAHGTGTPLGDPIEVNTLNAVLKGKHPNKHHCWMSSVKANLGHLESAAGIAGLIKTVLCLHHRKAVPQVNFSTLNPEIRLGNDSRIQIPRVMTSLDENQSLFAGVSSFGFGGTNAHVILQSAEQNAPQVEEPKEDASLIFLSAKSKKSLNELVQRYIAQKGKWDSISLQALSYQTIVQRDVYPFSLGMVAKDNADFWHLLENATEEESDRIFSIENNKKRPSSVAWVFPGQGGQYANMGLSLYQDQPLFRSAIEECAAVLKKYNIDLIDILYGANSEAYLGEMTYVQPALFSIQYALAKLLLSWKVEPDVLIGQSLGEYVVACIAGILKLPDALMMVCKRAALLESIPEGSMAVVFSEEDKCTEILKEYQNNVSIAAYNSENSLVLSGETKAIHHILSYCDDHGISNRLLKISTASHSPMTDSILDEFYESIQNVKFSTPQLRIISSVTGKFVQTEMQDANYWRDHIRRPVLFKDSIQLASQEHDIFVEINSKAQLRPAILQNDNAVHVFPSLTSKRDGREDMLHLVGKLHAHKIDVDWDTILTNQNKSAALKLPLQPYEKERYWVNHQVRLNKVETTSIPQNGKIHLAPKNGLTQPNGSNRPNPDLKMDNKKIVQEVTKQISSILYLKPSAIDLDAPLTSMGADSIMLL
ncbi:MAG: beta-ketoacyl synthase N-terminal-like domain-containing protein, partial [Bacteroidota bacterium]